MSTELNHNQRFVIEAREHLGCMTTSLMSLERGEGDTRTHIEQLLRAAHSIKGGAGLTGRGKIEQLSHALETALEVFRDRSVTPTPDIIDTLLAALDRLSVMVDDLEHSDLADITDLMGRLRLLFEPVAAPVEVPSFPVAAQSERILTSVQPGEFPLSEQVRASWQRQADYLYGVKIDWFQCERDFGLAPVEVAKRLEQTGTVLDSRMDVSGLALAVGLPFPPLWYRAIISSALSPEQFARQLGIPCAAIVRLESVDTNPKPHNRPTAAPTQRATPSATSLRISLSLIDRMMGLAGELVLVRNQAVRSTDTATIHLRQLMRRLNSITNELQDAALRMRMQPVSTLFDKFPRLVRDLARQLGKQIDIQISGSEVELDKTIVETLSDPLTHLVRNCCDHGVELPDVRTRAGKPTVGTINLSARQQGGRILIQIRDDGHGLDRDAIKRKALQQGARSKDELDRLTEKQIYGLILQSGFSTASRVTDLSGRGVGMDVVKTNLEQIGGVLEIDSAAGEGTVFTLSLPLTLAIIPSLLIRSGGQTHALPQRDIEEIILLEPGDRRTVIECSHDGEVLRLRGKLLAVTRLEEVLSRRKPFTPQTWSQIAAAYHPAAQTPARSYVAILRFGSQRFGLIVEELLGSEDIVVMPLHPLLRPLGVYGGATILGDGSVALILSGEGIARHIGISYRPIDHEQPALPSAAQVDTESHTLLLFRCGPSELLALSIDTIRRVVTIRREQIQHVGDRELINIDGTAVNVLRLDRLLRLSPCPDMDSLHLILPRHGDTATGFLVSEIGDTPTMPLRVDTQACRADGIKGSVLIGDQIALLVDIDRLLEINEQSTTAPRFALPAGAPKRILVVDDTQFFRELIKSHLESVGHEVALATNGSEALARLAEASFDLVISDIEMPVIDGLTLARRIREQTQFVSLPLLAVTTLNGHEDRNRAMACGFDAYEIKLDRRSLLANVGKLLKRERPSTLDRGASNHA